MVACIASLVSARGRRLGDVFAGTLVVRERIPAGRAGFVPPPPPWLVGRFAGLDLSAVPEGLWLAVRQYLTRMQQLDPQVSTGMAERLAADLAERTGTPVPRDLPPAAFLAAVVHERQSREARQVFGRGGGVPSDGFAPPMAAPEAQPPVAQPAVPPMAYGAASRPPQAPLAPSSAPPPEEPRADRPATGFAPPA
ncbi:hypothetical protein SHJG_4486 [Streptomyces hygroscopicus subsp. jinggangensis 5008]|nr:hypothetical protein SHJG_4486 [Streptomyces hygroscopicus subsp. jinggangensis 5008]